MTQNIWRLPQVLRTRQRLFWMTFLLVLIGVIAGAYLKRPSYESTARLLVKLDQRGVTLSKSEERYELGIRMAEDAVATQAELLMAQDLVGDVVDLLGVDVLKSKASGNWFTTWISSTINTAQESVADTLSSLGLVSKLSPRDAAIKAIQRGLKVYPVRKTQIISVSFTTKNQTAAPAVLNALIKHHLQKLLSLNDYSGGYELYRHQTSLLEKDLLGAENVLAEFKAKYAIVDLSLEKTMLIHKIEALTSVFDGINMGTPQRSPGEGPVGQRGLLTAVDEPDARLSNNTVTQLVAKLNELRLERARRLALYKSTHAIVEDIDRQIANAQSMLSREVAQLVKIINSYKARLEVLDRAEPELNRLVRDVNTREENYRTYSRATEDRRMSREQDNRVVMIVVDPASIPVSPRPPTRLVILLMGLVGSMVLAFAAVLAGEWLSNRKTAQILP